MNDIYTISMITSITIFILSTYISPGPTNIVLLSSVLTFGYKKSFSYMLGNIISYPLMMLITGLGVGLYLIKYPILMSILKILGIIYLCYMAYKIASDTSAYNSNSNINNKPFTFWQAFAYPWLNPKAWIVNTSAISIFVTSVDKSIWQISIIVFIVFLTMIITVYTWAFAASILKRFIQNRKFLSIFNKGMALLLLSSIIPVLFN